MNKNTLTAILMGFIICLGLVVVFLSIRLSLRPNSDDVDSSAGSNVVVENANEPTPTPEVTEAPVEPEINTVTVQMVRTTDAVNVRAEASTDGSKLGNAAKGSEFEMLEILEDVGWTKIKYNDGEAYIKSDYLESYEVEVEATAGAEISDAAGEDGAAEDGVEDSGEDQPAEEGTPVEGE